MWWISLGGDGDGEGLTAVTTCLDAIVDVSFVASFYAAQDKAGQVAVDIVFQARHLRCLSCRGAADHDGSGCPFAFHIATWRSGVDAFDGDGSTSRIGQFDLERFVLVLSFSEGGGKLCYLGLSLGKSAVAG